MIKFTLNQEFKSFKPFSIELPDFVILTGVNGAGKTQLLESLQNNASTITDENGLEFNYKRFVPPHGLAPSDSPVNKDAINNNINSLRNSFANYLRRKRTVKQIGKKIMPPVTLEQAFNNDNNQIRLIKQIAQNANKQVDELIPDDIHNFYPIDDALDPVDIFSHNFSTIFKRYISKIDDNQYREFRNIQKGQKELSYLTEEQFNRVYGEPPWEFVNRILAEAKLEYRVSSPTDSYKDAPFQANLINTQNGVVIPFTELSSGEKVLMSLALAMYNAKLNKEFPEVLLMDEPDASLHPSMSKQFIDVLQNIFVRDKGVKVLITTHSPSTIAFAPEESIYVVNRTGHRLEKSSKDRALKILSAGVPSFSINYENRRQVFVESPNDVIYFEKIYQRLYRYLTPEISLAFIASGESRTDKNGKKVSNCGQVINIVSLLRDAGNNLIWGIIDWDAENTSRDYIKVLGDGKRYSIENYLLDPVLISVLLLREVIIKKTDLGLSEDETYADIKNLSVEKLQFISDFLVKQVSSSLRSSPDPTLVAVQLLNGKEINMPLWYLHYQGHELEELLVKTFPGLNSIKRGDEKALKMAVIEKVINDMPSLMSIDLLETLKYVQTI